MPKLIILRGPSGAGKSTVAAMLHKRASNKTALFEQDHYRHRLFNNNHMDHEAPRWVMIAGMQAALEYGSDVILEGILNKAKYEPYFEKLFARQSSEVYFFYFDVSFEETARRHATRSKNNDFTAGEMREWYSRASLYGHRNEHIIPEECTAEQAYEKIVSVTGIPTK